LQAFRFLIENTAASPTSKEITSTN